MNNLKEWKALKRRYRTITLEEIEEAYYSDIYNTDHEEVSTCLTGFGNTAKCTLCVAVTKEHPFMIKEDCKSCMWYIYTGRTCMGTSVSNNLESNKTRAQVTFNKLLTASTPTELLATYKARYRYMLKVEKQYKEKQK